jgi:Fe2+ transport system protein B
MNHLFGRIRACVKKAVRKAGKTSVWLLKIILPISLLVRLLQYSGLLDKLSLWLEPVLSLIGLPGKTAIVFITSIFTPLYASVALITSMSLPVREATILSLMCLISHSLPVESAVQSKTGSGFWEMSILRIFMSFAVAFCLHRIMPYDGWSAGGVATVDAEVCRSLCDVFASWFISSVKVVLIILPVVTALMILHYLLDEFNLMRKISAFFAPLMKLFGLPEGLAFLWLVGNVVGLAYGSAIMIEQAERGKLSASDGKLLNYHLAVSHSLLEDSLIFIAIGIPALWIICTRLFFAIAVVWARRAYNLIVL